MREQIEQWYPNWQVEWENSLAKHTSFRIGGKAECFVEAKSEQVVQEVLTYTAEQNIPCYVLGNGSNLLVHDRGVKGIVLSIGKSMNEIQVIGDTIVAKAGATMAMVARKALEAGLTGLEFSHGIPGTIGGGVIMNAGAYGGELAQIVTRVEAYDREGEFHSLEADQLEFGYRTSFLKQNAYIVTQVTMKLTAGNKEQIKATMDHLMKQRKEKQPLEFPSAGSTFKRPEGLFAGKLIMDSNLAGHQIGGARVSEKHCGFVINAGNASSDDVKRLMEHIKEKVRSDSGVELEPEIIFWGFE